VRRCPETDPTGCDSPARPVGEWRGMVAPLELSFVVSADDVSRLPDSRAEVAVVGRSNVGKSSLLNALGRRKDLARVSRTPGRTRLLNCYRADGDATLVDCPGYGYAAVSKADRAA